MTTETFLSDIRELNLSYLVLAQAMLRADKAQGLFRLGISEPVGDMVTGLSPQQLVRIAGRSNILCAMRFDDEMVWTLLTDVGAPRVDANAGALHASVLMAGRLATTAA